MINYNENKAIYYNYLAPGLQPYYMATPQPSCNVDYHSIYAKLKQVN